MRFNLDVSKLKQDVGQKLKASDIGDMQKLTSDLAKLRKLAPGLDDLKNMMSPDADKIQKLSLVLKDVQDRIPGVEDISSLTRRGGNIQKLVPFWGGGDETKSNVENRAIAALSESEAKKNYKKAQKILEAPQFSAVQSEQQSTNVAVQKLKVGMNESRDLAQGFVDLQTCIGNFYKSVTDWMKQRNKLQEDILQLVADIKTTKDNIQKLTSKAFLSATSALGLGTLAAGAIALGILCPLLWVGAAFSGVRAVQEGKAFLDNLRKKNESGDEVQSKRNELDAKLLALEGLKRIQVILEPALSDLSVIGNKLWVVSQIWSFIHADIVGIEKSLDMASKGAREALFKARLETVTSVYSLLGEALSQYETAVKAIALGG
ncbi:hypothetical protein M404DRAFT_32243 [Pisolithus tinctorius Marx 270]|uniref:Uncharacterized protein n=1 Tax=Pisolithus tinctorius Marx 270 TaxID=870435 RepID=A0A0C3JIS9_PISTI|nr:hypothetical protein M404DRAFT_32243 [Pisolithus tinctorius Marx 270]